MLLEEQKEDIMSDASQSTPLLASAETGMTHGVDDAKTFSSTIRKPRKRLSASGRSAKRKAVAQDYIDGHPPFAIALRQSLNKNQVTAMLAEMLTVKEIQPTAPKYKLVPASAAIKALLSEENRNCEYVRVRYTDDGSILTPYHIGGNSDVPQQRDDGDYNS